ncbi:MAG: HD domain-containing protein [Bdellovibrionaceae bacterium]|nr:HD domain-containing protein [Pseudobdellovibrionaceae bacterium]
MENAKKMRPVPIDDLIVKQKVLVDLYVQLSDQKHVLIAKAGTNTSQEVLQKFKDKGVAYLYVRPEDFLALVKNSISIAGMAVGSKSLSNLSKLNVIEEALGSVYQEMASIGVNEQVLTHAKLVNEATMTVMAGQPQLSALVQKFQTLTSETAKHTMLVSMVAVMLGQGHEWIKLATLEKLALGGLLHDIGKLKLPPDIATQDPMRLSHDEMVIYKSHPELGRQMLAGTKGLPDDVLLIVYEHHERSDGSGFPRGLRDFQISPLARVVALANEFAEIVLGQGKEITERSARKALEEIELGKTTLYNKDAVRVLHRLVDGEPLKKAV